MGEGKKQKANSDAAADHVYTREDAGEREADDRREKERMPPLEGMKKQGGSLSLSLSLSRSLAGDGRMQARDAVYTRCRKHRITGVCHARRTKQQE